MLLFSGHGEFETGLLNEKHKSMRYFRSDVIRHQSIITRSTSFGVAKERNLKLDFMAKGIGIHISEFEDMFRYRDNENLKKVFWPYGHFKNGGHLQEVPNVNHSISQSSNQSINQSIKFI